MIIPQKEAEIWGFFYTVGKLQVWRVIWCNKIDNFIDKKMILFNKNQKTSLDDSSKSGVGKVQNAVSEKSENSSFVCSL